MKNKFLAEFIILFSLLLSATSINAGCLRFYQEHRFHFSKEIKLVNTLSYYEPHKIVAHELYDSSIPLIPGLSAKQVHILYRIGFESEIFCNPNLRKLTNINSKFQSYFFNAALEKQIQKMLIQGKDPFKFYGMLMPTAFLKQRPKGFPEKVEFRSQDHRDDFTSNFYYHLDSESGKLFIKPSDEQGTFPTTYFRNGHLDIDPLGTIGNRGEWNLHGGSGMKNGGPSLSKDEKIVEFAVASEVIFAVTNKNLTYLYKPTEYKSPSTWEKGVGTPLPIKLNFPNITQRKAWSFSCSVMEKPRFRRVEFIHPGDIVSYYEDSDGKKIAFGFTATLYILWKSGRIISFWDTGLPANFYRAFTTPDKGDFIAENISAAGSTIFIIGREPKYGEWKMFTRMYDYEINGACPGQYHTYKSCKDPDIDCSCMKNDQISELIAAHRKLPVDGWKEVQAILLPDGRPAPITTNITIMTLGEGNSARELRVEGKNELGETGYYFKKIDATNWSFSKTGRELTGKPLELLTKELPPIELYTHLAKNYEGFFRASSKRSSKKHHFKITATLKDFHYFLGSDEKTKLTLTLTSGRKIDLNLYAIDTWTLTSQIKGYEELIGDPDVAPKILWNTLEVPEPLQKELEDSDYYHDKELKKIMTKYINPFHHLTNALLMVATDRDLTIQSVPRVLKRLSDYQELPAIKFSLTNNHYDSKEGYFMHQAKRDDLKLSYTPGITTKTEIEFIIKKNLEMVSTLQKLRHTISFNGIIDALIAGLVYKGFPLVKAIALRVVPQHTNAFESLDRFIPEAMRLSRDVSVTQFSKLTVSYQNAIRKIQERIQRYKSYL